MRFKFRAWNKVKCEMFKVYNMNWGYYQDRGMIEIDNKSLDFGHEASEVVVMQWTGLKGKGDVDVYEGDIVRCKLGCPHVVEWVEDHGGTYIGGMPTFYLSGLNPGYAWTGAEEVIGNIYENPELIGRQGSDSTAILSESEAE